MAYDREARSADEPDRPVRQGDVLQLLHEEPLQEWDSHYGVVVTADCDLVHEKHGGVLTYVPVVPLDVYTRTNVIPAQLRFELRDAYAMLERAASEEEGVTASRISEQFDLGRPVEEILSETPSSPESTLPAAIRSVTLCRDASTKCDSARTLTAAVASLAELNADLGAIGVRTVKKSPLELAAGQIKTRLARLPGDALYLGRLSDTITGGFVAYLRLLREIDPTHIALSAIEERRAATAFVARRVGALTTLFLHRLVQQMAAVFTDIGLPSEYEGERDIVIAAHVGSITATAE